MFPYSSKDPTKISKLQCSQRCDVVNELFFLPKIRILHVVRMMAAGEERWKLSDLWFVIQKENRDRILLVCNLNNTIIAKLSIKLLSETAVSATTIPNSHNCCCWEKNTHTFNCSVFVFLIWMWGLHGYVLYCLCPWVAENMTILLLSDVFTYS